MSRPHEPFSHRILLRLLFMLGVLWLPPFAIAMPPTTICLENAPCEFEPDPGPGFGYCGDGACTGGESCSSCSEDCGECPVNTGDGHATCDGWDRQGVCALSFADVSTGAE